MWLHDFFRRLLLISKAGKVTSKAALQEGLQNFGFSSGRLDAAPGMVDCKTLNPSPSLQRTAEDRLRRPA